MTSLTTFLLARLKESAADIRAVGGVPPSVGPLWLWRIAPVVLKRDAAQVYADHPDYREEWRP